jgi:hypothetical protein
VASFYLQTVKTRRCIHMIIARVFIGSVHSLHEEVGNWWVMTNLFYVYLAAVVVVSFKCFAKNGVKLGLELCKYRF